MSFRSLSDRFASYGPGTWGNRMQWQEQQPQNMTQPAYRTGTEMRATRMQTQSAQRRAQQVMNSRSMGTEGFVPSATSSIPRNNYLNSPNFRHSQLQERRTSPRFIRGGLPPSDNLPPRRLTNQPPRAAGFRSGARVRENNVVRQPVRRPQAVTGRGLFERQRHRIQQQQQQPIQQQPLHVVEKRQRAHVVTPASSRLSGRLQQQRTGRLPFRRAAGSTLSAVGGIRRRTAAVFRGYRGRPLLRGNRRIGVSSSRERGRGVGRVYSRRGGRFMRGGLRGGGMRRGRTGKSQQFQQKEKQPPTKEQLDKQMEEYQKNESK